MTLKRTQKNRKTLFNNQSSQQTARKVGPSAHQAPLVDIIQRAQRDPGSLTPQDILHLQSKFGNRAIGRLLAEKSPSQTTSTGDHPTIAPFTAQDSLQSTRFDHFGVAAQAKLVVGPVSGKYEQEADQIARQVVDRINTSTQQTSQGEVFQKQALEREEDERMMKPMVDAQQRRHELDDDELQMKPHIQRRVDDSIDASPDLEASIQHARGSGQQLADNIKGPMEQAFGADFSAVRVHTDAQSDQLNRSIQARAFTTDQDIFFRRGAYNPNSRAGQELLAHELTHVVQQKGVQLQRTKMQRKGLENKVGATSERAPEDTETSRNPKLATTTGIGQTSLSKEGVIQLSPDSERLERLWGQGDCEEFFWELRNLETADPDVEDFIESTLVGEDLLLARRALAPPLTTGQRNALLTMLSDRLNSALSDYRQACNEVREDMQAEAEAVRELTNMVVSAAFAYIVPGLGRAIERLDISLRAPYQVARVVEGIANRAPEIARVISSVGNNMAQGAINRSLGDNPRDFCNAIVEGFQAQKDAIVSDVVSKIENRTDLPDENLWLYVANWDPEQITVPLYRAQIRRLWNVYEQNVLTVGTEQTQIRGGRDPSVRTTRYELVWMTWSQGRRLAIITTETPRRLFAPTYRFVRVVDSRFESHALQRWRTSQPGRPVSELRYDQVSSAPERMPSR